MTLPAEAPDWLLTRMPHRISDSASMTWQAGTPSSTSQTLTVSSLFSTPPLPSDTDTITL